MKLKKAVLILCIILAVIALASCGSSPSISNAQMTTAVDDESNPVDVVESYTPDASKFVVAATINNPQDDTYVTFVWKKGSDTLYEYRLDIEDYSSIWGSLTNENNWEKGDYSVEIYVDENEEPDQVVNFTVEGDAVSENTLKITDAHMATDVDSEGKPVDTVTGYETDAEKFTVSAIIRNAPDNTKITFVWYYEGSEVTSAELDSGDIADRYIYGYLTNDKDWPAGNYSVNIYLEDNSTPASTVNFTVE